MKKTVGIIAVLLSVCNVPTMAQMIINNTQTPQQLVQDVLLGQGVVVSNITFSGASEQIGYFNATNANFSMDEGIVMSSGAVADIPGAGATFASTAFGGPGDADLNVVSSAGTNDAVVLEFDFVPTGDSIKFDYVFGSEEYPEYVNAGFNDVFVFIISGPGFAGPFANGGENIALLPGTVTPVTIDNVNDGMNNQYYVSNAGGGANGIVYDGYTVTLTALAEVVCGETYHLKFAIADAGDGSYDSGVFLEANSFSSNAVQVSIETASGSIEEGGGWIVEGCTPAEISFIRPGSAADSAVAVPIYITGSAINGVDFTGVPDTAYFNVGDTSLTFTISAIDDLLAEIGDSIVLTVYSLNLCGDTTISTGTIYIYDQGFYTYETVASPDMAVQCAGDSVLLTATATMGNPEYVFSWNNGLVGESIWITPNSDSLLVVNTTDACGTMALADSVFIAYNAAPDPTVTINGPTTFDCIGQTALLTANGSLGLTPYVYLWSNSSIGSSASVTLNSDTMFLVTILDGCGVYSEPDTLFITQNEVAIPTLEISNDVTLDCPGDDAALTAIALGGAPPYNYIWSTGAVSSTINVQPIQTTEYIITVSDNCYAGVVTDTITVTVLPYTPVSISVTDTSTLCPFDPVALYTVVENGLEPFFYNWNDGATGASHFVSPGDSTDYTITVIDGCGYSATDTATVDVPVYDPLSVTIVSTDLLMSDTITICELWSDTAWTTVSGGLPGYAFDWSGSLIDIMYSSTDTTIFNVGYELLPDSIVSEVYKVIVTDQCMETDTAEVVVEVISCDIIQPNVFNPDSPFAGAKDFCGSIPQNNVFNLPCLELYPGNTVTIWDRWGKKCYSAENYHLNPWDGGNQATGVYFYVCELPDGVEFDEPVKGYFQLLR